MNFKAIVSQKAFWKSVFWLGLSFLVIYNIITMFFEYGGFNFSEFFRERMADDKLLRFVIGQFLGAFLYGFILAYGQFKVKAKKQ